MSVNLAADLREIYWRSAEQDGQSRNEGRDAGGVISERFWRLMKSFF